jgi:acetylornithine/N-succinyldiaminopimelate aminotransferase
VETIQEQEAKYIIDTYNRRPEKNLLLARGEGALVWDEAGREYLDFVGGLAVNVLGHCHPAVVEAICDQAARLIHTSNLYYTVPQVELARLLVEHSPAGRVFFANSGAEANEAAVKLARKADPRRYKIVTAHRSFHGRTLAMITATGQPKYRQGFEPLPEGFAYADFNDAASFRDAVDDTTAAIMIEPVQGEGGVHVAGGAFLRELRELCDEAGILLIFDEVQCGMGRTGKLWAFEHWGAAPDILTAAKGLGGGLPIGVMLATAKAAAAFKPGDHASTFGGNPVACRAALAVLGVLLAEPFLAEVAEKGRFWAEGLHGLVKAFPGLAGEVRGLGLISALELKSPLAGVVQAACQAGGLLVNAIGDTTLRFLPPLVVTEAQLEKGLAILRQSFAELRG